MIAAADSAESAEANLKRWEAEQEDSAELFYKPLSMAHMAGQLFVRQMEMPESRAVSLVSGPEVNFLSLPFDEAIEIFLRTNVLSRQELYVILDQIHESSYTFARMLAERTRKQAFDLLVRHMQEGGTIQDFVGQLQAGQQAIGITDTSPGYLRNVYRTGIATAYGSGRYEQLVQPAVMDVLDVRQYRATLDTRTRPAHVTLHGKCWLTTDPEWHRYAAPNGYQCRCAMLARDRASVTDADLQRAAGAEPDVGFNAAPGTQLGL